MPFAAMLDLGCGTGLGGAAFRPFADRLVGVDLSPAMVAQASAKGLYDRLTAASIEPFLAEEIMAGSKYDFIVAADVFVYVSDLAPMVVAAARVLAPRGLLAFTVETHAGEGVKLLPTLRYAHDETYIRAVLDKAGLSQVQIARSSVRKEKGVPVDSLIVVAQSSSTGPHA
jgi:predicted TPR repeat methyltransferase